ncbi:MAG: hypothetical protein EA369_04140 [Bradymonadales bacterium]|nr:MAG: hypothetical protein EA369_04140 [Bradymonadales bacterium]
MDSSRILFCDYDGEFEFADKLTRVGYLVDQIRPEALRSVTVGEHAVFILSFVEEESCKKALRVCEKLKEAELNTPLVLVYRSGQDPSFLNHQSEKKAADAYLLNPVSEAPLLDSLAERIGLPPARFLAKEKKILIERDEESEEKIKALEEELHRLRGEATSLDKALEAQRNFYKPRLKALLEGQKAEKQTEAEKMQVRLSELEAKLMDREARLKELEQSRKSSQMKIEKLMAAHQQAQASLRQFYQNKIKLLSKN